MKIVNPVWLTAVLYGLLVTVGSASVAATETGLIPVEEFAKPAKFKTMIISPDGEHIAFTYEEGNNEVKLAITDAGLSKITAVYEFGDNYHVEAPQWVSNERLIMRVRENTGFLDGRRQSPQLFIGGLDGSNRRQVPASGYFPRVLDTLENEPRKILIGRVYPGEGGQLKLHRFDIINGKSNYIAGLPSADANGAVVDVSLDSQDHVRVAYEVNDGKNEFDPDDDIAHFHFRPIDGDWQQINLNIKRPGAQFRMLGFAPDDQVFYFLSNYDMPSDDTMGVFAFDFTSQDVSLVFRHDDVDVLGGIYGPAGEVLGVRYEPGYPQAHYFDKSNPIAQRMIAFDKAFPKAQVSVAGYAPEVGRAVVRVSSDRTPGDFYLYENEKLRFLAAGKPTMNREQLGTTEAFTLQARDGLKLYGFVTLPSGGGDQDLPMVVYPHGGPHGPFDRWGYDPYVQLLASRGYAVLQVNFRGSGGYGTDFEEAGYRRWGREMQDDVTDATLWAINEGIADRERICIMGGSYGGYAALQGTVREPDLYQCALGYVGVYSLPMYTERGDYRLNRRASNEFIGDYVGNDEAELKAFSPAYNVDKIKADLFIVHGSRDVRVPIKQAEFLAKQLDEIGKPYEWMVRDEGHGFQMTENKLDLFNEMLVFFDRNIGPSSLQSESATASMPASISVTSP